MPLSINVNYRIHSNCSMPSNRSMTPTFIIIYFLMLEVQFKVHYFLLFLKIYCVWWKSKVCRPSCYFMPFQFCLKSNCHWYCKLRKIILNNLQCLIQEISALAQRATIGVNMVYISAYFIYVYVCKIVSCRTEAIQNHVRYFDLLEHPLIVTENDSAYTPIYW